MAIHKELLRVLAGHDEFWPRWLGETQQIPGSKTEGRRMIEIDRDEADQPAEFDAKCRQAGLKWLLEHPKASRKPGQRPRDYWSPFKLQLADAFRWFVFLRCHA